MVAPWIYGYIPVTMALRKLWVYFWYGFHYYGLQRKAFFLFQIFSFQRPTLSNLYIIYVYMKLNIKKSASQQTTLSCKETHLYIHFPPFKSPHGIIHATANNVSSYIFSQMKIVAKVNFSVISILEYKIYISYIRNQ